MKNTKKAVLEGKQQNKGGLILTAYKLYDWIMNNRLKSIRIIISLILLYIGAKFLLLGLNIFSLPYFIESVENIPEEYHFLVFAGFMYFFIKLAILLFDHGYNKFLDIFEEDEEKGE